MDNKAADVLITRISQGDMDALERLYNEYAQAVFAYAMTIVKNKSVAEDIMQDVFVKIYSAASSFKPEGMAKAWIMRITRNLSLNAVTRQKSNEPDDTLQSMSASERTEESAIIRVSLKNAMDSLDDEERQIITLHAVSDMTLGDIAHVMQQPLGTIKWKHARALKKLRSAMNEN